MSLTSLMVHDIDIVRAGTVVDRYSNVVAHWPTATSVTTKGWVSQRTRSEDLVNRTAEIADWVAFVPVGTDVTGHDRVAWADITFEVTGPPLPAWTPRGEHHLEISMRVITG